MTVTFDPHAASDLLDGEIAQRHLPAAEPRLPLRGGVPGWRIVAEATMDLSDPSCQGGQTMDLSDPSCQGGQTMDLSDPSCQVAPTMDLSQYECQGGHTMDLSRYECQHTQDLNDPNCGGLT
jgi:hypothetical protein